MKIITFYADAELPDKPRANQEGFDWRKAIKHLERSGNRFGYQTLVVTDERTQIEAPWLRVGDASEGMMMWLLKAQAAAVAASKEPSVMVSPDTLLAGSISFMLGHWDMSILTRAKPKPIVNSVIGFTPSKRLNSLWSRFVESAETLSRESLEWGADIDSLVNVMGVQPLENAIRNVDGNLVRFIPLIGKFESVKFHQKPHRLSSPIWDFKGARKAMMPAYAKVLGC